MYNRFIFLLLGVTSGAIAQVEIDYTLKMTIHPQQSIISLVNGDQVLECSASGGIVSMECGFNSIEIGPSLCEVPPSEDFGIKYTVENVDSCWGTNGTAEWQGTLPPYSGGSGTYTKTIDGGITEETPFTLNCEQNVNYTYESKLITAKYSEFSVDERYRGMIIWSRNNLFVEEYTEQNKNGVNIDDIGHPENVRPFIAITDKEPTLKGETEIMYSELLDNGKCNVLAGENNIAHVIVSHSKLIKGTCQINPGKKYYIIRMLFQKGIEKHHDRPAMKLHAN